MTGTLALWAAPMVGARRQTAATDKIVVLVSGRTNVIVFPEGGVLVDTGAPQDGDALALSWRAAINSNLISLGFTLGVLPDRRVQTVFNTHYHLDHTGNNERFSDALSKIIAHDRTRQWMSNDYWLPDKDRYEKARPKAAWPNETFVDKGSLEAAGEHIEYGHLIMAHTSGDIYVHFKDSNVLAVGDVASPVEDPELDWMTGAWIGGRVDAMDRLLEISNDETKIVPGTGPVMTRAAFKAERDMMEEVRARLFKHIREGEGPKEMLDRGVMNGLARTWNDPYKFLYAACKGLWANHSKLDANVV